MISFNLQKIKKFSIKKKWNEIIKNNLIELQNIENIANEPLFMSITNNCKQFENKNVNSESSMFNNDNTQLSNSIKIDNSLISNKNKKFKKNEILNNPLQNFKQININNYKNNIINNVPIDNKISYYKNINTMNNYNTSNNVYSFNSIPTMNQANNIGNNFQFKNFNYYNANENYNHMDNQFIPNNQYQQNINQLNYNLQQPYSYPNINMNYPSYTNQDIYNTNTGYLNFGNNQNKNFNNQQYYSNMQFEPNNQFQNNIRTNNISNYGQIIDNKYTVYQPQSQPQQHQPSDYSNNFLNSDNLSVRNLKK